ncbi:hypothetical protein I204_06895 [Kwoniella mangroviensis CBS 8886]|uniref:uncharacterized protein n=1 Tax=Kwoniella mangroviensis CBS 8507 TaxID=1296122 RepID=UPI00080CF5F9|nr:uncharacterized protein I203_01133 [Kwoniella mangroviensis CBS 8507]OCF69278.1 hypothetical protein I203_01133 [Kwoniella mangroviensis CBS 8507]OCF72514.1 hypothetical protein I204_06895 [Kwoniella mangroviensis CBS 8886]
MQGLVHYSGDSSPEPEQSSNLPGPSRLRDQPTTASPSFFPKTKTRPPSGIVLTPRSPKRPRRSSPGVSTTSLSGNSTPKGKQPSTPVPENLTHTAQSHLPSSRKISTRWGADFEGLSDDEIFKIVTMPDDIEGVDDWGIPPEVDPKEADETLRTKVEHFLKLKYERGEHINTRLLSSPAFANPHIYSKLVEFVSINERSSNFPSSGWLTRRKLEGLIPMYGPQALSSQQKAKQEAVKASQGIGQRREITFAPAKHKDKERDRGKDRNGWDKDEKHSHKHGHDYGHKDRDRQRDRDRDRDRKRDRDRR